MIRRHRPFGPPSPLARLAVAAIVGAAVYVAGCGVRSRLGLDPAPPEVAAGLAHLQANDVAGAQAQFDLAIRRDPKDPATYMDIAAVCSSARHPEIGAAYLEQGAHVPGIVGAQRATLLENATTGRLETGNTQKATADSEEAYRLTPTDWHALNGVAYTYAVELDSDMAGARDKLVRALQLGTESVKRARDNWPSDPKDVAMCVDTVGWVQYKLHDYPDALANLERAADTLPDIPDVQYHVGCAYEKMKRYPEAAIAFKRALNVNPRFDQASTALIELAPLLPPATNPKAPASGAGAAPLGAPPPAPGTAGGAASTNSGAQRPTPSGPAQRTSGSSAGGT